MFILTFALLEYSLISIIIESSLTNIIIVFRASYFSFGILPNIMRVVFCSTPVPLAEHMQALLGLYKGAAPATCYTPTIAHMENYHIFFNTRYFIIAWFLVTKECVQHLNTKLFGYVIFCLSWVNFRSVYFSLGANVCTLLPPPSYHHLGVCVELNIYMIGSARMRCCCCCCCC